MMRNVHLLAIRSPRLGEFGGPGMLEPRRTPKISIFGGRCPGPTWIGHRGRGLTTWVLYPRYSDPLYPDSVVGTYWGEGKKGGREGKEEDGGRGGKRSYHFWAFW